MLLLLFKSIVNIVDRMSDEQFYQINPMQPERYH